MAEGASTRTSEAEDFARACHLDRSCQRWGEATDDAGGFEQIPRVARMQEGDVAAPFNSPATHVIQQPSKPLAGVDRTNKNAVGPGQRLDRGCTFGGRHA